MFKWLKFWDKPSQGMDQSTSAIVDAMCDVSSENEHKPVTISEPVTSFLKCFLENPRRFKLTKTKDATYYSGSYTYIFTDEVTSEGWEVRYRSYCGDRPRITGADWLTDDERDVIIKTVVNYYKDRMERLHSVRSERHKRKMNKERERLTKIYKGE